jgi:hypothetical protein
MVVFFVPSTLLLGEESLKLFFSYLFKTSIKTLRMILFFSICLEETVFIQW